MDLELQGRVATITGGGRGIGKAVALALAEGELLATLACLPRGMGQRDMGWVRDG